ncbi:MAG: cytochrome c oxidase assembly protein, partial [Acidimicrobiaceae bacterium]|nr:cytochrome c oxidase assembly protein [Acidimicrobiaceae bacterium]
MGALAATDAWRFQFHPEVWLMVAAIVGLGFYVVRVVAPAAGPAGPGGGTAAVTGRQRLCFVAGVALLWVSADWPMHDIAEEYLYSVHMVQHLLISFVVPPLLLMAVPEWLARLILVDGSRSARVIRRLVHPLVAGVAFNALQALMHWNTVVELSVRSGPFHYAMHLLMFASALAMWTPVVGPLRELHLSEPMKMVYLFTMSIIPTVPAAWLTFAEGSVYPIYDHAQRLWGISVAADQQAAGAVMKVLG